MTEQEIDGLEAGPELDALIAEKVMGWIVDPRAPAVSPNGQWPYRSLYGPEVFGSFCPSRSIVAAWEVVRQMARLKAVEFCVENRELASEIAVELEPDPDGLTFGECWLAFFEINKRGGVEDYDVEAEADTAPLAICRAALKAVLRL